MTCFTASYRSDCVRQLFSHDMEAVATAASASLRLCKLRRAAVLGWLVMVCWCCGWVSCVLRMGWN